MPGEFDWFPLYPRNFLTSRKVKRMSNEEVGIYAKLLFNQWIDGSIPDDIEELANMCGCQKDVMTKAWQRLSACFTEDGGGGLYNEFLEEVREEQKDRSEKRSRAGKAGAAAKHSSGKGTANEQQLPESCDGIRGDDSKRNEIKENMYDADFEEAWALYPDREGGNPKKKAYRAWKVRLKEGVEPAELIGATARYAEFCDNKGMVGTGFVKMASTFYGPDEHWRESYDVQEEPEYVPPPAPEPLPEYTKEQEDLNRSGMTTIKDALAITKEGRPPSHNFQAEFEEIISKHGVESAPAQAYAHKWGNKLRMPDDDQM